MRWWNGISLNEAFATLMELLCVDAYRPDWQRWVSFGIERDVAMATDSLHATRPVEYPVGPPEEAQGMFDVLTYQKGAGVLRMLERYLGAEVFRDGVRLYLDAHRFGNTETADLWSAIERASGQPVRDIMDTWLLQGGFPLVSVGAGDPSDAGEADAAVTIEQEPFSYAVAGASSAIGSNWSVPVIARAVGGGETRTLLQTRRDVVAVGGAADRAVVVNAGGSGYYRVRYAPEHWRSASRSWRCSSGSTCSATPGPWWWPGGPTWPSSSSWPKPWATKATPTCGPRSPGHFRFSTTPSTTSFGPGSPPTRARCSPLSWPARAGTPPRVRTPAPQRFGPS
jgi:aminopeptidase N